MTQGLVKTLRSTFKNQIEIQRRFPLPATQETLGPQRLRRLRNTAFPTCLGIVHPQRKPLPSVGRQLTNSHELI